MEKNKTKKIITIEEYAKEKSLSLGEVLSLKESEDMTEVLINNSKAKVSKKGLGFRVDFFNNLDIPVSRKDLKRYNLSVHSRLIESSIVETSDPIVQAKVLEDFSRYIFRNYESFDKDNLLYIGYICENYKIARENLIDYISNTIIPSIKNSLNRSYMIGSKGIINSLDSEETPTYEYIMENKDQYKEIGNAVEYFHIGKEVLDEYDELIERLNNMFSSSIFRRIKDRLEEKVKDSGYDYKNYMAPLFCGMLPSVAAAKDKTPSLKEVMLEYQLSGGSIYDYVVHIHLRSKDGVIKTNRTNDYPKDTFSFYEDPDFLKKLNWHEHFIPIERTYEDFLLDLNIDPKNYLDYLDDFYNDKENQEYIKSSIERNAEPRDVFLGYVNLKFKYSKEYEEDNSTQSYNEYKSRAFGDICHKIPFFMAEFDYIKVEKILTEKRSFREAVVLLSSNLKRNTTSFCFGSKEELIYSLYISEVMSLYVDKFIYILSELKKIDNFSCFCYLDSIVTMLRYNNYVFTEKSWKEITKDVKDLPLSDEKALEIMNTPRVKIKDFIKELSKFTNLQMDKYLSEGFSRKWKELMEEEGVTGNVFGINVGVKKSTISRILSMKRVLPSLIPVVDSSYFLNKTLIEVMPEELLTPIDLEILSNVQKLPTRITGTKKLPKN